MLAGSGFQPKSSHVEKSLNNSGGGKGGISGPDDQFVSFEDLYHHTIKQIDSLHQLIGSPRINIEIDKIKPHCKTLITDFMQPATIQLKLTLEHKDEAYKFEKELQVIHQKLQLNLAPKKCRVDSKFRGAHSYNYFGYIDQFIEKVAPLLDSITPQKTTINASIPFKISDINITSVTPKS